MCETCGCGNGNHYHIHDHDHDHDHSHDHHHVHHHDHDHGHDHGNQESSGADRNIKVVDLNRDILSRNNLTASRNRRFFEGRQVLCLNMVSSPGSGKTSILEKTIAGLNIPAKIYVIEGDQQTQIDAGRIEKAGAPAIQINTGSGCHLDAAMVESALNRLKIASGSILFIENVGNLVCPAMFDLGETKRVLVMSVTEGEDKPLKYPQMFETSHLCLINKSDLLPYVDFNVGEAMMNATAINPNLEFICLSARTGEGMDIWHEWIRNQFDRTSREL